MHLTCEGLIYGRDLTVEPLLIQLIGRRPELMQKIIKAERNKSGCNEERCAVLAGSACTWCMPNVFLVLKREQMKFGQALPEASQQPQR